MRELREAAPNDTPTAVYGRVRGEDGRLLVLDAPLRERLPAASDETDSSARAGRRVYWAGSAHQPRREGTVVAVYREPRDGSAAPVLVVDVRWDPPSASERPRGPLSLGIPVARIGTLGWGWVDEPDSARSHDPSSGVASSSGDQRAVAMRRRFGVAVRRLRMSRGMSQEQLAFACGLHRTFVGAIERGESNISLATLARLAKGLDVSVSRLAAEAESVHDER